MASENESFIPTSVLITGSAGFIASNFTNYFVEKYPDVKVVAYDRLDKCASKKNLTIWDKPNFTFVKGDICSLDLLLYVLDTYKIDTVIHAAAQSSVDFSFENSLQHTRDNVLGTHTLLEACRQYGKVNRILALSTDETYGDQLDGVPVCERAILMPNNPYSASKAGAEMVLRSYTVSYGLPTVISRGNNAYGERQFPEKLIPKFALDLLKGKKVTIHGDGSTRRNFLHVMDTVTALETILVKGKIGEIYNIGIDNEFSVLEITELLRQKICPEKKFEDVVSFVQSRPYNDTRYWITSDKLRALGWKEQIPFEEGLDKTIEWYKQYGLTQWA